jgi:hypothetical protein
MEEPAVQHHRRPSATFGWIIGGIAAIGIIVFILSGGSKQTVEGDHDLPPIAAGKTD